MSDWFFTLLLCLSLTLQDVCTGFHAWTLLQYTPNNDNSVSVICQHNAPKGSTVGASLLSNNQKMCDMSFNNNDTCKWSQEGNQFNFTLKNLTVEQKQMLYYCKMYRSKPIPVQIREGGKIKLFPDIDCPPAGLLDSLSWALIGIAFLLCLYGLIITVVYIKLRMKISEELTLTYVPMQQNQVRPKNKVKRHKADNTEYMDMREVHQQAQPIRDMNHNSHPNPVGFAG